MNEMSNSKAEKGIRVVYQFRSGEVVQDTFATRKAAKAELNNILKQRNAKRIAPAGIDLSQWNYSVELVNWNQDCNAAALRLALGLTPTDKYFHSIASDLRIRYLGSK